jgi:hypothetical protein
MRKNLLLMVHSFHSIVQKAALLIMRPFIDPEIPLQDPSKSQALKEDAQRQGEEESSYSKMGFCRVELEKLGVCLARPWAAKEAHQGVMLVSDWPHLFLSLPRWEDVLFSIFLVSSLAYFSARILLKSSTRLEDSKEVVLPPSPPTQTSFVTVLHVPTPTSDIFLVLRPTPTCTDAHSRYLRNRVSSGIAQNQLVKKKVEQIVARVGTALSLSPRATEILGKWAVWGVDMFRVSLKFSRKVIVKSQRLAKHRLKAWKSRFDRHARDWIRD